MRLSEEQYQNLMRSRGTPVAESEPSPAKPKQSKLKRGEGEHLEQCALIEWCDYQGYPYNLIFAIPNGGDRNPVVAAKMKAEGVRKGVLDLLLPVARGRYHGFFIEMKYGNNKPSDSQLEFADAMKTEGYHVGAYWGWEDAAADIVTYISEGANAKTTRGQRAKNPTIHDNSANDGAPGSAGDC